MLQLLCPGLIFSIVLNGLLGSDMALALLLWIDDVDAALNTKPNEPFINVIYQAVQDVSGVAVMTSIIIARSLCATVGIIASAFRKFRASSWGRADPGWQLIQQVHFKSAIPVLAVLLTVTLACILALVVLSSPTTLEGVVSLSVVGLVSSYLLVAAAVHANCTQWPDRSLPPYSAEGRELLEANQPTVPDLEVSVTPQLSASFDAAVSFVKMPCPLSMPLYAAT